MGQTRFRPDEYRFGALVLVLLFILSAAGAGALPDVARAGEDAAYVSGIQDLPLMPGLAEVQDAGVVFDKPSGRIVEAYAEGAVSKAAVVQFYLNTLPQLGWRAKAESLYAREGENLGLNFLGGDGALIVRFTLQPE
jgi:hypothetical protein